MRLIDADALKEEIEFHPTSVSVCMTVAEAKGQTYFKNRCLEDIDNAPTIDAIPVEWIETLLREWLKGSASFEVCCAISAMLYKWKIEQEAR